jgi:hypothetical protein
MSTPLLRREAINLDIEPRTFAAHSLNPFGMRVGKLTLEVDREGFRLLNKKGRTLTTMPWIELEEFKNEVREKGRFLFRGSITTGMTDATGKIRVGLGDDPEDREGLAAIFDKLPPEVTGRRCSDCSGAIIDNVCRRCGATFTGQQRRKGAKYILIGSALVVLGVVLSSATYSPSSGTMWLFYGPIVAGGVLAIAGLIGLVFGKRV